MNENFISFDTFADLYDNTYFDLTYYDLYTDNEQCPLWPKILEDQGNSYAFAINKDCIILPVDNIEDIYITYFIRKVDLNDWIEEMKKKYSLE